MMKRTILALACLMGVARAQSVPTPTLPGQPANKGYVDATSLTAVTSNADVQFAHLFGQTFYSGAINGFQDGTTHTLIGTYGTNWATNPARPPCSKAVTGNETVDWCVVDAAFERGKAIASTGPEAGTSLFGGPKGVKIDLPGRIAHYDMGCTPLAVDDMSLDIEASGLLSVELGWTCPIVGALQFNLHATQPKSGQLIIKNVSFVQYGAAGGVPIIAAFNNVATNLIMENVGFTNDTGLQGQAVSPSSVHAWGNGPIIINPNDIRIKASYERGWPGTGHTGTSGVPDPQVVSSTTTSITLTSVPANTLIGENLNDMTNASNLGDGCVVTSVSGTTLGTSCDASGAVAGEYIMISSWGMNFYAPNTSQYYPAGGTLGHFGINVEFSKFLGYPSGAMAFFANTGVGIQGLRIYNNGAGNTDRFLSFYNARGLQDPSNEIASNQMQIDENMVYCEFCSQVNVHDNKWYAGAGGGGAPHPLPLPNVAFLATMINGNNNIFAHNLVSAYPQAPDLVGFIQTTDNHDSFDTNIIGQGAVAPVATAFQLMNGSANQTEGLDAVYQLRTLTANATSAAGSSTVTILEANAGAINGWTLYPGLAIDDATNVLALPGNCPIKSITGQVVTLGCPVNTGQSIASGDVLKVVATGVDEKSNWASVSATSNAGSSTLQFEPRYMPQGLVAGMNVYDLISTTAIPQPCQIDVAGPNFTTGVVPLTCVLAGPVSVGNGNTTTADVIDFDGTIPGAGGMNVAPVEARLYDSTSNFVIGDNFDNVTVNPNGNFSHLIKLPNLPRRGQVVTVTDEPGIANLYPFTLVGTINVGQPTPQNNITNDCINGVITVKWTGNNGWVLQNYVCHRNGSWTPVMTDANVGDGFSVTNVTASATYSTDVEPTGKCWVEMSALYTGTPSYTGAGAGVVTIGGAPINHDANNAPDELVANAFSGFTWPNGSTQIGWESIGQSNTFVLRGTKSGSAFNANTLVFSMLTSGSPITLGIKGRYRANGC